MTYSKSVTALSYDKFPMAGAQDPPTQIISQGNFFFFFVSRCHRMTSALSRFFYTCLHLQIKAKEFLFQKELSSNLTKVASSFRV